MAGFKAITVNTDPAAEPHIYAEDDAAIFQSIVGTDGVMAIGGQCESEVISNNKVRVNDGVLFVGGHFARIPYGDYVDCEIANGQSGVNRNDIIVAKFVTTGSGGIDTFTCEVKQGTEAAAATDPVLTKDDLYQSGKTREMPLYRVKIEGISIVKVEKMFSLIQTIPYLQERVSSLSSSLDTANKNIKTANDNIAKNKSDISSANTKITNLQTSLNGKEATQKRTNSGVYYKNGYDCFLHAADVPATDVVKTLAAAYRPKRTVVVSGWCLNNNTKGFYPCVGKLNANGTWSYLSALQELGQETPYYIYNASSGTNVLSRFSVWLVGAWATNTNGA